MQEYLGVLAAVCGLASMIKWLLHACHKKITAYNIEYAFIEKMVTQKMGKNRKEYYF